MPDLLLQAMYARQKGDVAQAKQLLAQALIQDPRNEGAWMLMSEIVDDVKLKRNCLQRVLLINPENSAASIALMKLDTSPLGPVVRGERYKPVVPPKLEKAPPFTPPFTWTGDEAQFQALGEMTYPDLTGEEVKEPPETPTTFDWAADSGEPDKTIDKIFNAVSNPELAAAPVPDSDLGWRDEPNSTGTTAVAGSAALVAERGALEDQPIGTTGLDSEQISGSTSNPTVNTGEKLSTDTFAYDEEASVEAIEFDFLLWDNPKAKIDRMVILGSKSIIYANPSDSDVPHILGLFKEKKMLRDLLGEDAGTIKLETIQRLSANPKNAKLDIEYKPNEKALKHQLTFSSPQERNDALDSLELRVGAGYTRITRKNSLADKILVPMLVIVVVVAVGWILISGLSYLESIPAFQSGILQLILINIQYYVNLIGPMNIFMIAIILVALSLVWLVINLSKPSNLVIIERMKPDPQ